MNYDAFKKAELEGWNARAAQYNDYTGQVTTQAIPHLLAMADFAPGERVLDLCCGTGSAAGAASALGAFAEGIDVAPEMIKAAKARFPEVRFHLGDAEALPRPDSTYDAVIIGFGVMHVGNPETMLREAARVLKPGGRLALSHWIGPPESEFFKIVFGTLQKKAELSRVPPSPPPFALSSAEAMSAVLGEAGFGEISVQTLPLQYRAPAGAFAQHFRQFAARAAVILDCQDNGVLEDIYAAWDAQLAGFVTAGQYLIPMPALAVSAVRKP